MISKSPHFSTESQASRDLQADRLADIVLDLRKGPSQCQ